VESSPDTVHPLDEAKLTALFAGLPLGVVVHGPDSCVITANASALEILGLSLAQIIGKPSMDPDWQSVRESGEPFPGEQHPAMICLASGAPVRDVVMGVTRQATRERRWLRINANPLLVDGKLAGAYACFEDITERRSTEIQLADAREKLDLALAGANLGTYDAHFPSGRVTVNDRYLALLGYAPGELEMSVAEWMDRIHPDDLPRTRLHHELIFATTGKYVDIEYRLRHKAGHWVWLHDRGRVFEFDAANNPVRVAGTQLDISTRKQAEQALQESEARYRTVVETAPYAILIYVDQHVVMANPACVRLFGADSEQELLGRDVWSMISSHTNPSLRERIESAMRSGGVKAIAEVEILRRDGTSVPVDGVSVGIDYHGRHAIHVMMQDARLRRQAETLLLRHHEEMKQLLAFHVAHQTVAGIAHELNQPLNAVTTLAEATQQLIKGLNPLPRQMADTLDGISQGAQRAGRVVHELMGFLKKPAIEHRAVDLGMLVHEAVAQCEAGLPFSGKIQICFPSVLPKVKGNALQLEKIVQNLLRNAMEACQSERATSGKASIVIEGFEAGANICLQVSDNGPGVPAELRPRLFHPFVSTKVGGIGMGLAISDGLARSMKGTLEHEPAPGGGARFRLMLPIYAETANGLPV
jgi:PAS domain S-box-containing protein